MEPFFDSAELVIKLDSLLTNFLMVLIDNNESLEAGWMKLGYGGKGYGEERKWVLVGFWRSSSSKGEGGSHGG